MKLFLASILLVVLSGCSTTASMVYTGVDTITSFTTGKNFVDNVFSYMTEKDCKVQRLFKGDKVCIEDE